MSRTTSFEDTLASTLVEPAAVPCAVASIVAIGRSRIRSAIANTVALRDGSASVVSPVRVPGGRLGQYELIREIGRGGMGSVYLARDLRLGRRVAIKLLRRHSSADNARFLAESRVTARCNHENIVVIYDVGEFDHHPYMVLEYLAGETLGAWLAARTRPSNSGSPPLIEPGVAVGLMLPVVRALAHAHDMGIVHRDLKPANIMLTAARTVKVLDFGIATLLADAEPPGDDVQIPSIEESGALIGTLPYMSPEQLEGEVIDRRTDIWAVGIMLYEMVTGAHPVIRDSVDLQRALPDIAALDLPMPRVGDHRPGLGIFADVIDRCLYKDKTHRTPDAHVLLRELEDLVRSRDIAIPGEGRVFGKTSDSGIDIESPSAQPDLLELPEGIVRSSSPFYVTRPEFEQLCMAELVKDSALLRIKGPRQIGKTTLMMRLLERVAASGSRTARVDLQVADARILGDLDQLLRWLCLVVGRCLKIPHIDDDWDGVFGPKINCLNVFEAHFLCAAPTPLVLTLASIDRLFAWPRVADEFLTFLRALHEMSRAQDPWAKLRLVLEYSTEMYLPMDVNHSPFNVGLVVGLTEWDAATVTTLAHRHGLAWGQAEVTALMGMIGGQPYLVRVALYHAAKGMPLAAILAGATTDEGIFADHLKHLLWRLQQQPDLAAAAARVLVCAGPIRLNTELAFKLVSLGLVHQRGDDVVAGREIYRRYLTQHLDLE